MGTCLRGRKDEHFIVRQRDIYLLLSQELNSNFSSLILEIVYFHSEMAAAENRLTLPNEKLIVEETSEIPNPNQTAPVVRPQGETTSDYYRTESIPERFEHPEMFQGYGSTPQNPMYRTTNMAYGNKTPTVHTMPTTFRARSQKFSVHLGTCGMYRNQGLNTALDQSKV